jgi:hypothetical protein
MEYQHTSGIEEEKVHNRRERDESEEQSEIKNLFGRTLIDATGLQIRYDTGEKEEDTMADTESPALEMPDRFSSTQDAKIWDRDDYRYFSSEDDVFDHLPDEDEDPIYDAGMRLIRLSMGYEDSYEMDEHCLDDEEW